MLHSTVLLGKLRQAVCFVTNREGEGYLILRDVCTKTGRPVAYVLQEKQPDMCVPPVENLTCADFKKYGEVPEKVHLDFSEDDFTRVASKLSGSAEELGAEAIELRNWTLCFRCASEEYRVVTADLANWMANSSPPLG